MWFISIARSASKEVHKAMPRYNIILVDGDLAIKWEDEPLADAVERARARAASAERALRRVRREVEAAGLRH
jgi:hypothetical protein